MDQCFIYDSRGIYRSRRSMGELSETIARGSWCSSRGALITEHLSPTLDRDRASVGDREGIASGRANGRTTRDCGRGWRFTWQGTTRIEE